MQTKTILVRGVKTRYFETSASSEMPLILLHGWGSQAGRWQEVMNMLEGKKIRAIALDLPGFGQSTTPAESWGLDEYANFILDFLKSLRIESFHLLGHSFGGRIAIKLAAQKISNLEKLILVASAGVTPRNKTRIFLYKFGTKLIKPIFSLPFLRMFADLARKIIYKFSGSYDYYVQKGVMRETFRKVITEDLTPYLHKITASTCIIWGDKDKMTPLSDAHIMHRHIKNSQLTIIENGNHSLNLQMPKRLAEEISNYVMT